ncbi:MAG: alpha-glucan family phosphorylase [Chitinophagales bacterium]|nr:alpha-glucan family phosphorylase [Chitinophagales bacterium]MDW8427292.1 alpha-glucan family phosphorylase [Chitinophagales bacterium]
MTLFEKKFNHRYRYNPAYKKAVAYFSMEFAIDQPLKTYSGGLGFLAGSHMRSAFELRQNLIGIGILWKYGYYDQVRRSDQTMDVAFLEKAYSFLEDTNIRYTIEVNGHPVWVTAKYLPPRFFNTVPVFFLTTDLPENDYLAQTISHRLYDSDVAAKVAQYILLGIGGAKLLDYLGFPAEVYHLNEAHALPSAFYLYQKFKNINIVRQRLVFTTHTPEEAGNEKHDIHLLHKMGYFCGLKLDEVRQLTGMQGDVFDHSLCALRLARRANAVSQAHGKVARKMWSKHDGICQIYAITNAQNALYWADHNLYELLHRHRIKQLVYRKKYLKKKLFDIVADQTGKIFNPDVLTIVWARRFAGYKRADLLLQDPDRFHQLLSATDMPVQLIYAGKPYPTDYGAVATFNKLVHTSKNYPNMAVLTGYELRLSACLKQGADVWLNTPRLNREASGTSGMTAAMNGAINFSTYDGWIPEFATEKNSFIIPPADANESYVIQDVQDVQRLYDILFQKILPMYYQKPGLWLRMMRQSMKDILPFFDSARMADEYYRIMYDPAPEHESNLQN